MRAPSKEICCGGISSTRAFSSGGEWLNINQETDSP